MSYLIFCSYEVGGLPYKMAEILKRNGVEVYYVSLDRKAIGHDSTKFHYGNRNEPWDLSYLFKNCFSSLKIVRNLRLIKKRYNITACLATGSKSYLLKQADIDYKYWSYGADLDQQCFSVFRLLNYPFWKRFLKFIYNVFNRQTLKARKSILLASSLMIAPYQITSLDKICSNKKLFFLPHFLRIFDYEYLLKEKIKNKKRICEQINAKNYFFSSTRHFWQGIKIKMSDNKGNNVIFESFARYIKISKDYNSKIIVVEKGPDVEASKLLTKKLKIDKYVVWVKEMKRDELNMYYQGATLCFGQFGTPVVTFASLEPLSNATPCISFFDENKIKIPFYKELPPLINSNDPYKIAELMHNIINDDNYYSDLCYRSWLWVKNNCSEEVFVKSFLELFKEI